MLFERRRRWVSALVRKCRLRRLRPCSEENLHDEVKEGRCGARSAARQAALAGQGDGGGGEGFARKPASCELQLARRATCFRLPCVCRSWAARGVAHLCASLQPASCRVESASCRRVEGLVWKRRQTDGEEEAEEEADACSLPNAAARRSLLVSSQRHADRSSHLFARPGRSCWCTSLANLQVARLRADLPFGQTYAARKQADSQKAANRAPRQSSQSRRRDLFSARIALLALRLWRPSSRGFASASAHFASVFITARRLAGVLVGPLDLRPCASVAPSPILEPSLRPLTRSRVAECVDCARLPG